MDDARAFKFSLKLKAWLRKAVYSLLYLLSDWGLDTRLSFFHLFMSLKNKNKTSPFSLLQDIQAQLVLKAQDLT